MRKYLLVLILAAAVLGGGTLANTDIVAEAASGDNNSAWKKLLARVTALEDRVKALEGGDSQLPVSIEYIVIEDGECAAPDPHFQTRVFNEDFFGWCPDGVTPAFYEVEVEGISENSTIIATMIIDTGALDPKEIRTESCYPTVFADIEGTGRDVVSIASCNNFSLSGNPANGSDLRLTVFNPPKE